MSLSLIGNGSGILVIDGGAMPIVMQNDAESGKVFLRLLIDNVFRTSSEVKDNGFKFYVNTAYPYDPNVTPYKPVSNLISSAVEVTDLFKDGNLYNTVNISADAITYDRVNAITALKVVPESGNEDNISSITATGVEHGDILLLTAGISDYVHILFNTGNNIKGNDIVSTPFSVISPDILFNTGNNIKGNDIVSTSFSVISPDILFNTGNNIKGNGSDRVVLSDYGICALVYVDDAWRHLFDNCGTTGRAVPVTIPAAGGTLDIDVNSNIRTVLLKGTVNLTSSYSVTCSQTPPENTHITVISEAVVTLGVNMFTIFGVTLTSEEALSGNVRVDAIYVEGKWKAYKTVGKVKSGDIDTDAIDTSGGLEIAGGKLKVKTDNATIGVNGSGEIYSIGGEVYVQEVTIPSASVLSLNTNPVILVPAQGAGKAIMPLYGVAKMTFNSSAYATNGNLIIKNQGATKYIVKIQDTHFLFGTISRAVPIYIQPITGLATDTFFVENSPLEISVEKGNPTAGDSDIAIRIYYRVIDV